MKTKTNVKKVAAIAVGVGLVVGGLLGAVAFPVENQVFVDKNVTVEKIVDLTEAQKNIAFNAGVSSVVLPKDLSKELADEKVISEDAINKLHSAVDFIEDNVDEDASLDYIVFEADARVEAEALIHNSFKSLIKDEDYFDNGEALDGYRTSEISIKTIEDAVIEDRDFEDKDLVLSYEVKVKAKEDGEDREYFNFEFTIPFEDGILDEEGVEVSLI